MKTFKMLIDNGNCYTDMGEIEAKNKKEAVKKLSELRELTETEKKNIYRASYEKK